MKNIIISVILYIGINATFPILESNAQVRHITGTVTNSKTGISIPNITVRIKNTNLITTTDKAGKYKLEVPDVIRSIEFSNFEGMEVRSVDLVSDSIINIKLSGDIKGLFDLSLAELLNLKITTAGRKEEKIADIPANVIIITREEIEKYGYLNFREILENVPGIYITEERNDGQVGVNIRGYWKDMTRNVIIMINSVPQLFNIMKSYPVGILNVPVESIERIEIIKGPMSVIYGSGAFFGAINIITNTKEIGSSTSLVSISAGNNCAKKTVARVAIYKNDISLNINGALFETKGEDIEYNSMMTNPGSLINKTTGTDAYRIKSKFFNLSASFKDFYSEISYTESNAGGSYLTPPFENDRRSTVFNSMRFV
ncbi:MAG: TonB-dependent receptor plug domain-containing protein, partial [bacterium]|nr:TonB-dependent receptor plug domain-containing protein [bacterium]